MPFRDNNVAAGIAKDNVFQVGESDPDRNTNTELGALIPWPTNVAATWVYFDCTVAAVLDSGIVVHNRLPQVNNGYDTLASVSLDDPNLDVSVAGGVNLKCKDQYLDIVQRMGHSRYWFRLWGQALRVGRQVPIPGLVTVGGVPAIPYDKNAQWAFNRIMPGGNYGGVILWHAAWSLWYTTDRPPVSNTIPAADPSAHILSTTAPPRALQASFSQADDEAVAQSALRRVQ